MYGQMTHRELTVAGYRPESNGRADLFSKQARGMAIPLVSRNLVAF